MTHSPRSEVRIAVARPPRQDAGIAVAHATRPSSTRGALHRSCGQPLGGPGDAPRPCCKRKPQCRIKPQAADADRSSRTASSAPLSMHKRPQSTWPAILRVAVVRGLAIHGFCMGLRADAESGRNASWQAPAHSPRLRLAASRHKQYSILLVAADTVSKTLFPPRSHRPLRQ